MNNLRKIIVLCAGLVAATGSCVVAMEKQEITTIEKDLAKANAKLELEKFKTYLRKTLYKLKERNYETLFTNNAQSLIERINEIQKNVSKDLVRKLCIINAKIDDEETQGSLFDMKLRSYLEYFEKLLNE